MKAMYIQQYGPIEDLRVSEREKPSLKPGEVLVSVEAAGINPSDLLSARGSFPNAILPRILGRDFAGRVVEGPSDLVGAEVWGTGGDLGITRDGTHAEYLAVSATAVARRPESLATEAAAVAGVPFVTAHAAVITAGQLNKNEWIIVSGAAGAVGQAAIQLAKAAGARVIALIRNQEDKLPDGCEVDVIAESEKGNLEQVVREATNGAGANLALNGVGASIMDPLLQSLSRNGRMVVYSSAGGNEFNLNLGILYRQQISIRGVNTQLYDASHCAQILTGLAPLIKFGALKPSKIAERFSLDEAPQAYRRIASGVSGKLVLIVRPD